MRINEYIKEYYPCMKVRSNHLITKVTDNSKHVIKGSIFMAVIGHLYNGFDYIDEAIKKGAKSIFLSDEYRDKINFTKYRSYKINIFYVSQPKIDLARLSKVVYLQVYEKFPCLIGVTGTAGKTSVTTIIYETLKKLKFDCLLFGSSGNISYYGNKEEVFETHNTTPSLATIYELMSAHDLSYDYVIIEVSSQGLVEGRVLGLPFDYSIITSFASEHLEYHHSISEYKNAKARLLQATIKATIINTSINQFNFFNEISSCKKITYGLKKGDYHTSIISANALGSIFLIHDCDNKHLVNSSLLAEFNIENILASYALLKELGISGNRIISIFNILKPISGRMNQFSIGKRQVIIDYAHTVSAIEAVLKHLSTNKLGRLITVIGCGGNRDQSRRPIVGMLATKYSDLTIFTEDNSRKEVPIEIIKEMLTGVENTNYIIEENRQKAIHKAFMISAPLDTIAILGKGNEKELIKDVTISYSDEEVINSLRTEYE